ncbi:hemagglutinin protein HagB [gut metagenome]|uniref:Hemagglutinin protein HagB n=1 Tax=gut metagenome TaxID=749906 RepID=J9GEC6_9ZZZZ
MTLKPSAEIRIRLRSAQYLMYMQTFLARAKKLETENTLFTDGLKAFEAAVAEVDASVRIATKSKMTINVTEADAVRDRLYSLLKSVVVGWASMPALSGSSAQLLPFVSEYAEAARPLADVIALYNLQTNTQLDDESGKLQSILRDMRRDGAESITKLQLTELLSQLETANKAVIEGINQRAEERGAKVAGALKAARLTCDEAYLKLEQVINALSVLMPSEPLTAFIRTQNDEIDRLDRALASGNKDEEEKNPTEGKPGEGKPGEGSSDQPTDQPADKPTPDQPAPDKDQPSGNDSQTGVVTPVQPEKK